MKINRTKPPEIIGETTFQPPQINSFYLNNGIEALLVTKPKLPIVIISLNFFAGSNDDPINKSGLVYLTSLAIDEGAGNYSALELDYEFEKIGAVLDINASSDVFSFSILTLKENFNKVIELLSVIINKPLFNDADFNREKIKAQTSLIRLSDEPDFLAGLAFQKVLLNHSPYSKPILGKQETLKNISPEDCKSFANNFLTKDNSVLTIVGDISHEVAEDIFNKYFYIRTTNSFSENNFVNENHLTSKFYIVNKKDSPQSEIRIGKLISNRTEKNHFARVIWNSILGGEFVSRINLNLRENKGYTYGAHSYLNYMKTTSYFTIATSVDADNTINAVSEIYNELEKIRENITNEEIDFAKSFMVKKFSSLFETYQQIARHVFTLKYFQLPKDYFQSYITNIQNVSRDEIMSSVREEILTEEMKLVIVGDVELLQKQGKEKFDFLEIKAQELI